MQQSNFLERNEISDNLEIETNDSVEIAEVREFTDYGDGTGSTLVQVNRLPEME